MSEQLNEMLSQIPDRPEVRAWDAVAGEIEREFYYYWLRAKDIDTLVSDEWEGVDGIQVSIRDLRDASHDLFVRKMHDIRGRYVGEAGKYDY